jgi:DNA-binding FrmR family transcriptional regulator
MNRHGTDELSDMRLSAEGQIRGVIRLIEEGRDCAEIVTQRAAVSLALDQAGFKIIVSGLRQCVAGDGTGDLEQAENLFLSLA